MLLVDKKLNIVGATNPEFLPPYKKLQTSNQNFFLTSTEYKMLHKE